MTENNRKGSFFLTGQFAKKWIAGIASLCLFFIFCIDMDAQFAVTTNGGSGLAPTYPSLADAVTALNAATITSPVVITCPAGGEYAPSGGYAITASGTAANTIIIQGNGIGSSFIASQSPSGAIGSLTDAIFKIIGGDYITISGFTMEEHPDNNGSPASESTPATNTMTEWGVALLHASPTNGAQYNTIQNNAIKLYRFYSNSFGVYSNNRHSATAITVADDVTNNTTGPNSGNKVYGNLISQVNMGIAFIGTSTSANQDISNDIGGGSVSTGNSITNWGGLAAASGFVGNSGTSYCIFMNHQVGDNISFNTISSGSMIGTAVTVRGIFKDYSTGAVIAGTTTITNNTVTILHGFLSGTLECIRTQGIVANTSAFVIDNNKILNTAVGATTTSTTLVGISNASAPGSLSISNNIFQGNTSVTTSGGFQGINNNGVAATSININNNQIGNASGNAITFSAATSGNIFSIINGGSGGAASTLSISSNDIRGIVQTGSGSGLHMYISNSGFTGASNINNNTFTNLTANTTGDVTFISNNVTHAPNTSHTVNGNSIVTAFNKSLPGGVVLFYLSTASSTGTVTETCNLNNFSNVTVANFTTIAGFESTDGTSTGPVTIVTNNTFNNISGGVNQITILNVGFSGNGTVSGNTISNVSSITGPITGILSTSGIQTFTNNTVTGLSSTGTSVLGISITGGTNQTLAKNKIGDLQVNFSSGTVNGILVSAGTVTLSNNRIGDLRAIATNASNFLIGINITGVSTVNAYYNSVYLNGVSSGALFGSSAISANSFATLTLNNNIFVNTSTPNGAGLSVAYRRSGTNLASYAASSNRNDFFAPTIYTDGTNTFSTFGPGPGTYQNFVAPRDANSYSVPPPFLSTVPGNANFLKINTLTITPLESGAANIAGIVDDFENDVRQGNPGYPAQVNGGGFAPDIGADEFDGTPCIAPVITGQPSSTSTCEGQTATFTVMATGSGLLYAWEESTNGGMTWNPVMNGGMYSNATTATLTITGVTSAMNNNRYQAIVSFSCGSSITSDDAEMKVVGTGTWLGSTSTDWFTTSNWCGSLVPIATTDVVIGPAIFQPVITGANAVCRHITIEPMAALDIVAPQMLSVMGE